MTAPTHDFSVGKYAYEEVNGYERTRTATYAALCVAAIALLVDPLNIVIWLGLLSILASERTYRRAAYRLLGGTTANRISAVTFRCGGHLTLLVVVGLASLGAVVWATAP